MQKPKNSTEITVEVSAIHWIPLMKFLNESRIKPRQAEKQV